MKMQIEQSSSKSLMRLGGIAGLCVGLFILTFAGTSESQGILFVPEVMSGGSIEQWVNNIQNNPNLIRLLMSFPVIGFSSMLVVGLAIYQLIAEKSWQKNLSLAAYAIGIPTIVSAFVSHGSLINQLLLLPAQFPGMEKELLLHATIGMDHFMLINFAVGPFFVIMLATPLMAWAALRSNFLPKWLCYWAFFNGTLEVVGALSLIFPILGFAQASGPLTMLWFVTTGVILLKKK